VNKIEVTKIEVADGTFTDVFLVILHRAVNVPFVTAAVTAAQV